jgi:hypothetical protein
MAIASLLLYLAVFYIRPGEIIPGWEGIPFAEISGGLALFVVCISWLMRPRGFLNQALDAFVAAYFVAALLSNPVLGWFGGAFVAYYAMIPSVLGYYMIRAVVRDARHLRWVGYALLLLTLFQAVNGIVQFKTGVGLGEVLAFVEKAVPDAGADGDGEGEAPDQIRRIRGTGIFNDPNDLAMAFVVVLPFLVGPLLAKRTKFRGRVLVALLFVPLLTALYYTNSRGGILGLAATLTPHAWRSGRKFAKALVVLGLLAMFALAPSRMSEMDSDESSAQGRIQAWSAGLEMLKSRPILGVGFSNFEQFHERVAHNSFVHTFGELGLIGGFCFAGMFYWVFRSLQPPAGPASVVDDRIVDWGFDLKCGALGLFVCTLFLSRQYNIILFIWFALAASYRNILQERGAVVKPAELFDVGKIFALTIGGVAATYVAVRVLAVYSAR